MRADGLPLYLEELTKAVLESPQLRSEVDRDTLGGPRLALPVPRTLEALLIERMGRRKGVSRLAQVGAVIGRTFSYELLAAVVGQSVEDFDDELEELTRTNWFLSGHSPRLH